MISRRKREKDFKKQLIVEAAYRLFSESSFEAVTVEDIARAAEFGKGTIYQYFSCKEEIFSHILKECFSKLCTDIEQACLADVNPMTALDRLIELDYHFYKKYGQLMPSLLRMKLDASINTELYADSKALMSRKLDLTTQVFEKGIRDKIFITVDSLKLARIFNKMIIGLIFEGLEVKTSARDTEKDLELIKLIVFNGIIFRGETNGRTTNSQHNGAN